MDLCSSILLNSGVAS